MPVSVVAERRWSVTAPVSLDGISGSATWSNGGVVGATPIDVAAERGARVIIDVNPLVPIRKHGRRSRADARSVRVTRAATHKMRYRATACWQACRRTHGPALERWAEASKIRLDGCVADAASLPPRSV